MKKKKTYRLHYLKVIFYYKQTSKLHNSKVIMVCTVQNIFYF